MEEIDYFILTPDYSINDLPASTILDCNALHDDRLSAIRNA